MKQQKLTLKNSQRFKLLNNSATNNSVSKQTHSFSKSSRFLPTLPTCPRYSYGGNDIIRKQSGASIGYGNKSDFTKDLTCSPSPSKYRIKDFCEINLNKKFTFGINRQKLAYRKVPPSNRYSTNSSLAKSPRYTIGNRTKILDKSLTIESQNYNPGPGEYQDLEASKSYKYSTRSPCLSYDLDKFKRFKNSGTHSPGPGTYHNSTRILKGGRYITQNHTGGTIGMGKFGRSRRVTLIDEAIHKSLDRPGPGNYRVSSEFGIYDDETTHNLNDITVPSNRFITQ